MAAVIFTHPADYECAGIAARAARDAGCGEVVAAVHRADPVCHMDGARVVLTDFPRGGNLNGIDCARGILATLARHAGGEEWVIKLDSDTILSRLDWLPAAGDTRALVAGTGDRRHRPDPRPLYGACYAVRAAAIPQLMDALCPLDRPCEDILLGRAAARLCGLRAGELHRDGHLGVWRPRHRPADLIPIAARFPAVLVMNPGTGRTGVPAAMRALALAAAITSPGKYNSSAP